MAQQTDLDQVCKDYYVRRYREVPGGIDYSKLKLKEDYIEWTPISPKTDYAGPTSELCIKREHAGLDAYGAVETRKDNNMLTLVNITEGCLKNLKGPNSTIRLTLPKDIQHKMGKTFGMNISETHSKSEENYTLQAQSGQKFPEGATEACATVTSNDSEYTGDFDCLLKISGPVFYLPSKTRVEIGEIFFDQVKDAKVQRYPGTPKSDVIWTVKGSCKFVWKHDQKIEWKSKK